MPASPAIRPRADGDGVVNAGDKMHSHPKPREAGLEAMDRVVRGTYCTD